MVGDDTNLIGQARGGDRAALERLLGDHAKPLRLRLLHGIPARARGVISVEDVVQETLIQAFLKIDRLRGDSPKTFAAWLFAIGDMTLISLLRKETAQVRGGKFRRKVLAGARETGSFVQLLEQLPGDGVTASRTAARQEAIRALQVAIAGLPTGQRQAIRLHVLQGKTLEETSEAMDRTTESVRSLVFRAKENLSQAMGRASMWLSQR